MLKTPSLSVMKILLIDLIGSLLLYGNSVDFSGTPTEASHVGSFHIDFSINDTIETTDIHIILGLSTNLLYLQLTDKM